MKRSRVYGVTKFNVYSVHEVVLCVQVPPRRHLHLTGNMRDKYVFETEL